MGIFLKKKTSGKHVLKLLQDAHTLSIDVDRYSFSVKKLIATTTISKAEHFIKEKRIPALSRIADTISKVIVLFVKFIKHDTIMT
jgi:hypothetical protein